MFREFGVKEASRGKEEGGERRAEGGGRVITHKIRKEGQS